jgi:DNA-binding phage protein
MIEIKTIPWNTEDHLETPEDFAAYLEAVFEDGDSELIGHALGADGDRPSYRLGSPEPVQGPVA